MTTPALTYYTTEIHTHECPECGVAYGLTADFEQRRRQNGGAWYCPNGHSVIFSKPEVDKLRVQLASERERREHAEAQREVAERRRRAAKGQLTKVQNRIRAGVCPFCTRHFVDLERHVASKHGTERES